MTPLLRGTLPLDGGESSTNGDGPEILDFNPEGSKDCKVISASEGELRKRSLCPWHYVLNQDPNRYPDTLAEAVCNCKGACADESLGKRCEGVYYNIRVLQNSGKCDEDGYYKYEQAWYQVRVGCVCAASQAE